MKRSWVIPAILVAGLVGFGGTAQAASAEDAGWRDGGRGEYSGQRWRDDDRRGDDDRGSRWRRGDDDRCGPRGRGYGRGGHGYEHHGRGYGRHHGYDRRHSDRAYGRHGGYHGRHGGHGPRRFGRGFDPARLDGIKKEIGVTEAQEQAWTKYAATLKEVSDARKARRASFDRGAISRMSPDEHRTFRDSMIDQRRKEQDSVNAAVDELVKSLDEKQVAIAKEALPGYAFGRGMRGAGMGWGGGRYR